MTAVTPLDSVRKTAGRLLGSSSRNSYSPDLDIDWDAPIDGPYADKKFMPYERVSLYGTPLWDQMSEAQRRELSKHELASVASTGLWFEILLVQMLSRWAFHQDPQDVRTQYALTEIGDETRHILMFAKAIERLNTPTYRPGRAIDRLAQIYQATAKGPTLFAPVLVAEEITDRLQREMVNDESVHPLVRMVNRIHVVEEARHVRFAREEVERQMRDIGPIARVISNLLSAVVGAYVASVMVSPDVYARVGLDPKVAAKAARTNPNYQATAAGWARRSWPSSTAREWSPGTRSRFMDSPTCSESPRIKQPPSHFRSIARCGSAGQCRRLGGRVAARELLTTAISRQRANPRRSVDLAAVSW